MWSYVILGFKATRFIIFSDFFYYIFDFSNFFFQFFPKQNGPAHSTFLSFKISPKCGIKFWNPRRQNRGKVWYILKTASNHYLLYCVYVGCGEIMEGMGHVSMQLTSLHELPHAKQMYRRRFL